MLRILPVASGSTGNCMLAEIDDRRILIDLGITASMLRSALTVNGYTWGDIDAVLITHTHSDHIKGLEVCLKRITAPVFMSGTSKDRLMLERAAVLNYDARTEIIPGLWVTAIRTAHDCPGSIGFKIETAGTRLGYITDLGVIPESTMELLAGSDCIVIESNHDEEMLRYGAYPAYLKRRILSECGHLSNEACAEAVARFADEGTRTFFLAHLSRENNRPKLALESARRAAAGMDVKIEVLPVFGEKLYTVSDTP
jgi:phosphoribosyl 1,2-cyclic phosphodiesterase